MILEKGRQQASLVYGTQTGMSFDAAQWLSSRLPKRFGCKLENGNQFFSRNGFEDTEIVIFVVSTAGNGDFPIGFARLWSHLIERTQQLDRIQFAVFGLGDSKYPQFNHAARKLYGRLLSLGARAIIPLACGDEQHKLGYFQEFHPWVNLLWRALFMESSVPTIPAYTDSTFQVSASIEGLGSNVLPLQTGKVQANIRVTSADHFQDVRVIRTSLIGSWEYEAGDVMVVVPPVPDGVATSFIRDVLRDSPDRWVDIRNPGFSHLAHSGRYSLLQLFTKVCDITSTPTHLVFERLRDLLERQMKLHERELSSEEETVREKLDLLASFSPDGAEERLRYSHRERLGIHEVLYDFRDHIAISVDDILDVIPLIQPRYYSICNACKSSSSGILGTSARIPVTIVETCVAVVDYKTFYGRKRQGLASTFLAKLIAGDTLHNAWLERGFNRTLARGIDACKSAVLIGPGTGISPLRAIIQKYDRPFLLLTGFRHDAVDFLFQSDIETRFGKDVTTLVAWSRPTSMDRDSPFSYSLYSSEVVKQTPNPPFGRKTWVQDLITTEPDILRDFLLREGVMIVISGRSHPMPFQVTDALRSLVGDNLMKQLQKSDRVVFDTWG